MDAIPEKCGTMAFSPMADLGYEDPLGSILRAEKTHTLRRRRVRPEHSYREVTVRGKRTGVILRITHCELMRIEEFLSDDFAQADGLRDADALATCLRRFYGKPPATMWRLDFEVARAPQGAMGKAMASAQEAMDI